MPSGTRSSSLFGQRIVPALCPRSLFSARPRSPSVRVVVPLTLATAGYRSGVARLVLKMQGVRSTVACDFWIPPHGRIAAAMPGHVADLRVVMRPGARAVIHRGLVCCIARSRSMAESRPAAFLAGPAFRDKPRPNRNLRVFGRVGTAHYLAATVPPFCGTRRWQRTPASGFPLRVVPGFFALAVTKSPFSYAYACVLGC